MNMVDHIELRKGLQEKLGDKLIDITQVRDKVIRADLKDNQKLLAVAFDLRDMLGMNHCILLTAVDYIDSFECVYHLSNTNTGEMLELRVFVSWDSPRLESLAQVWEGINWHEREAFDLMGIDFQGHPDLRRILLPENWEGHPLRKDYIYPIEEEEW